MTFKRKNLYDSQELNKKTDANPDITMTEEEAQEFYDFEMREEDICDEWLNEDHLGSHDTSLDKTQTPASNCPIVDKESNMAFLKLLRSVRTVNPPLSAIRFNMFNCFDEMKVSSFNLDEFLEMYDVQSGDTLFKHLDLKDDGQQPTDEKYRALEEAVMKTFPLCFKFTRSSSDGTWLISKAVHVEYSDH